MRWRKHLSICVILLGSFFIFGQSERSENEFSLPSVSRKYLSIFNNYVFAANSDIVITEIGAYEPSGHEWIEIWNKGAEPLDITGWKFWEFNNGNSGGNGINHAINATGTDAVLAPDEYAVIVDNAINFIFDYPFFTGSIFDSSFSLVEYGEEIGIKDGEGNFVEQFTYIPAPNFSLQRRDPFLMDYTSANWQQHSASNTIGSLNFFASTSSPEQTVSTTPPITTSTSSASGTVSEQIVSSGGTGSQAVEPVPQNLTSLKINEFVADPETENEWVELYNTAQMSIDIAGTMLCDNRNTTSTCKKLTGSVGPNSWLLVDLQTRSFLNNAGDSAILKDSAGSIIDRIDYEDELVPDEGQSLARKIDGVDTDSDSDWVITNMLTPGAANIAMQDQAAANENTSSQKTASTTAKTTIKKIPSVFVWNINFSSSADINEMVTLNAEGIADPRGGSLSFLWTLENGQKIVGPEIKISFVTSGAHRVGLFVTSTSGYGEEKKIEITVGTGLSQHADIIISEILPNPDGDDNREFIELKNNAAGPVNLFGWFLRVGEKEYAFLENTFIAPGNFLVFYKAVTKFSLVNTTGKVELLNKDKAVVDLVKYEEPVSGKSYALTGGEWRWVDPSPGTELVQIAGVVAGEKIIHSGKTIVAKKSAVKFAGPLVTTIAGVREAEKGQPAKLQGIVSVLPNVFGSQYFYINDGTGGAQIYQNKKDFPPLGVGDMVEIVGIVSEANGIKRVNVRSSEAIDILSLNNKLDPILVNPEEIDDSVAGALVQVEGEITEIKSTFMYVDNGAGEIKVYFKKNAKINKQQFKEGEHVRVIGILEKVQDEWQVWPRSSQDLESLGAGEVLGEKIEDQNLNNAPNRYLIVTSVGIVGLFLALLVKTKGVALVGWLKKKDK
ncbi:MAG: lamin tail domain-containing protein [Candidatus Magasanikbacteria bacterium]|nr:lamin tail domain-containing protein [Candidatus Magasanikbacteria bacterium]